MNDSIITGLDIGSSKIRVVVGKRTDRGDVNIIGLSEVESEGVNKGVVRSVEDVVSSVSKAFEYAEKMTGIPIESAFVSISGPHIRSQNSQGVIAVAGADGEIKQEDVERAIESSQTVSTPPNYEILHVIPKEFSVDNQKGIKDPIGMTGRRLEVDVQIIQGLSAQIKNLTKVVYRSGVDVDDLVVASLASAEAVLSKRQKELGVCLLNIGGATTSIVVFEEGEILHTSVIPVGSSHITNDIAIGLRTSIDTAEEVKIKFGTVNKGSIDKREDIDLSKITEGEVGIVSRRHVAEVIEARTEEIFKLADNELEKLERSGKLPAGVVITGGGAKLDGMILLARKVFRLPSSIGIPREVDSAIDKIDDPSLSTAVGLVKWGEKFAGQGGSNVNIFGKFSHAAEISEKIRNWFKSFLP